MKIVHKKNTVFINLAIGLIWFLFILVKQLLSRPFSWFDLIMLGMGIYYLSKFYYLKTRPYLVLTDSHFIQYCILKTTRIPVDSLKGYYINKSGDLVLISETNKIWISSNSVSDTNLNNLRNRLRQMGFPSHYEK